MRTRLICVFLQVEPVQIICAKLRMFAAGTLIANIISRVAVSKERRDKKSANHPSLSSPVVSANKKLR